MSNTSEKFLIDTNAIITPFMNYYPFDFAPAFWKQMKYGLEDGSIIMLDMVLREISVGDDKLSEWLNTIDFNGLIDHRQLAIIKKYSEILAYIQTSEYYNDRALSNWSQINSADPWLIATASVLGYTIITFETPSGGLNKSTPSGRPKIPDICSKFNVKWDNLYYMMRQLSFMLG